MSATKKRKCEVQNDSYHKQIYHALSNHLCPDTTKLTYSMFYVSEWSVMTGKETFGGKEDKMEWKLPFPNQEVVHHENTWIYDQVNTIQHKFGDDPKWNHKISSIPETPYVLLMSLYNSQPKKSDYIHQLLLWNRETKQVQNMEYLNWNREPYHRVSVSPGLHCAVVWSPSHNKCVVFNFDPKNVTCSPTNTVVWNYFTNGWHKKEFINCFLVDQDTILVRYTDNMCIHRIRSKVWKIVKHHKQRHEIVRLLNHNCFLEWCEHTDTYWTLDTYTFDKLTGDCTLISRSDNLCFRVYCNPRNVHIKPVSDTYDIIYSDDINYFLFNHWSSELKRIVSSF